MDNLEPTQRPGTSWRIMVWLAVFLVGVGAGRLTTTRSLTWPGLRTDGTAAATTIDRSDFTQFWQVWNTIKERYAYQPVDETKLYYGAIAGLVESLNDPHSLYLPPTEAKEFAQDLAGEFEGIGAEIDVRENQLIILAPLAGSPAEKAGLKARDAILLIDDKETAGLPVYEAVKKIRGPKGTQVKLLIRTGETAPRVVTITRATINVPTVTWEMKANNVAYIRISSFNEKTDTEFDKAVREVTAKKSRAVVLDLRSNPGGYLDRSIMVASEWLKSGVVVRERFVDNQVNEYQAKGRARLAGLPTVVLVDGGSASGAEIVAGALQDNGVAKLVGTKTYGKGSVQDFQEYADGSALKLTVAKWFTPKDRQIDKIGIMPDITVDPMFVTSTPGSPTPYVDKGLEKALELLR